MHGCCFNADHSELHREHTCCTFSLPAMLRTCNLARLSLYKLSWVQLARCGFKLCTQGQSQRQPGLSEIFSRVKASHSTCRYHEKACTREPGPPNDPPNIALLILVGTSSLSPQAPGEEKNKLKVERLGHITACLLMKLPLRLMLVSVELLLNASAIASPGKDTKVQQHSRL